jgi:hypothetical protein
MSTYEGRPFVLVRKTAVFHEARTHRLPVLTEADLLARYQRRPECVPPERKRRVTDPGYHLGRTPKNKGRSCANKRVFARHDFRKHAAGQTKACDRRNSCKSPLFKPCSGVHGGGMERICAHCGTTFTQTRKVDTYIQRFCSRSCGVTAAHEANRGTGTPWQERFWLHVPEDRSHGCWEWRGTRRAGGYGRLMTTKPGTMAAHRASWIIHNGPIPHGMVICHRCDNPPCVNPAHLFLGTQIDNIADMVSKGRQRSLTGTAVATSKFSEEEIQRLRDMASTGLSFSAIARETGVSKAHVRRVVRGQSRRHG